MEQKGHQLMTTSELLSIPFGTTDHIHLAVERYYDAEFFDLERRKLWPHSWQVACRPEDIPRAGDFLEYQIVDQSILVVRGSDQSITAFQNACRHRATALGSGSGTFHGGKIVCPFHGWRFELDGTCSYIYGRQGFAPETVTSDKVDLLRCQVAVRHGFVWINMDPTAPPLDEALGDVDPILAALGLDRTQANWWRQIEIGCNWKIALEAFMEGYHILQTHPDLAPDAIDEEYDPDAFGYTLDEKQGHGWMSGGADVMPMKSISLAKSVVLNTRVLFDGVQGWCTPRQMDIMNELWSKVPDSLSEDAFLAEFITEIYADGVENGTPLPETLGLGLACAFPNLALINNLGNSMVYRFRPSGTDPEKCIWDIWSLSLVPESATSTRPTLERLADQSELPEVYGQDASNMELQQKGLRSSRFGASVYSPRYEPIIPNMHRVLDEYLAR